MNRFIFFATALTVLCSCRTQRETTTVQIRNGATEMHDSAHVEATAHSTSDRFAGFRASSDSVTFTLTADSLIAPDGTRIFAPVLTRHTYTPAFVASSSASDTATLDIRIDTATVLSDTVAVVSASHSTAQSVAVAEPPSLMRIIFGVLLVMAVAVWMRRPAR